MRRIHVLTSVGLVAAAIWINLLRSDLTENQRQVVQILPLFLLVSLGCYALGSVGYGVMVFPSCPEEAALLQEDIKEAKKFLSSKGLVVEPKS